MLLRPPGNKFMPLKYVFPGGSMDIQDKKPDLVNYCQGLSSDRAMEIISDDDLKEKCFASWTTGIRETFEETGILFAYDKNNDLVEINDDEKIKKYEKYRRLITNKKINFDDIIKNEKLKLSTDRVYYFSHWITPRISPIRFDTRFFLARAPEKLPVSHDEIEITNHVWITPSEALHKYNNNKFNMAYPTVSTLETIVKYKTLNELIQSTIYSN